MITGAHSIIYSTDADADRLFLRDVLGLSGVDVGGGWLIFGLPPAEVAVHPADSNGRHELYLLCDNAAAFVAEMEAKGVACAPVRDQGWGLVTVVTLPSSAKLGVYEPRHPRPESASAVRPARQRPARGNKKPAAKPKARTRKPKRRRG